MAFDFMGFMIMAAVMGVVAVVWKFMHDKKNKGEHTYISYSELVGDSIREHNKVYIGYIDRKEDILNIPKLNLKRPIPRTDLFSQTTDGNKIIHLIRIDTDRYGFFTKNLHNQVMVYKRDEKGNIQNNDNGKPKIISHKWQFCEDVVEPDVKHWEEQAQIKIQQRHQIMEQGLMKWLPALSIMVLFLLAVILNSQSTRELRADKMAIMESAEQMQADAKRTQDNLNTVMERLTGKRVLTENNAENVPAPDNPPTS